MSGKNRLSNETSPYLIQHAENPVDWYPWSDEALDAARKADKPILLSIGYSACHWCHVMAHESFEDPLTAKVMNSLFINIKVDREERPDIDKIYQLAHQLLTQRAGGWPLTMFLTPDRHIPYFGGTYFPPEPRHNMPGFSSLLQQAANYYQKQKDALQQHNLAFEDTLLRMAAPPTPEQPEPSILEHAVQELSDDFDADNGGFGQAPKFPHPTSLEFLLSRFFYTQEHVPGMMLSSSLHCMANGGIYDHIGGGFCRYSVDERWNIPHFEKMLYDNGPLLALYANAWQIFSEPLFKQVALDTAEWVMRDMQDHAGGYYSSLDADSEGQEGKFYVWTRSGVQKLLSAEEFELVNTHLGLSAPPNFEGRWHFYATAPLAESAKSLNLEPSTAESMLRSARSTLFDHRRTRISPHRDEKILTSWNGLMIRGMAVAGRIFNEPTLIDSAQDAFDFLYRTLWVDGRLVASYKDNQAHLNAYLDDYVFLIDAALELVQARWNTQNLIWAQSLADFLLEHFEDRSNGGFFFTSDDHERLIHRPKPMTDESTASGNGVAASVLYRLGQLLGNSAYLAAAQRTISAGAASVKQYPGAHGAMLSAVQTTFHPYQTIIIRGTEAPHWQREILAEFHPGRLCLAIPDDEANLPGVLSERKSLQGTTAYLCQDSTCLAPVLSLEQLRESLQRD